MQMIFCLIVGSLFVVRTNRILRILGYMSPTNGRIVLIAAFAVTILASWVSSAPQFFIWLFAFILFVSPKLALMVVQSRRRREFHNETARFFDRMLLGVRSGVAAREVLRRISKDRTFGFHTRDLADACLREEPALFGTLDADFRRRAEDLRRILGAGQRCADRLSSLRRTARMRERFQRKSRNATQPVRAQVAVILSLYIGLLALQAAHDPEILMSMWSFGSATLITLGLYVIERQRRSFKWKI